MKARIATLALGAALAPAVMPGAAQAQPVTGLYIAGGAGFNWLQSSKDAVTGTAGAVLATGNAGGNRARTEWDLGWGAVASIGYGFGNGLRAEVEGNYRENDLDSLRFGNVNPRFQGGRARSYGVMANAFYDFNIPGFFLPVQPYVGGGVGYVWHEYDGVRGNDFATGTIGGIASGVAGRRLTIDDSEGNFAYQGIAGVAFNLAPGLALTAEYRFLGTLSPRLNATLSTQTAAESAGNRRATVGSGRFEADNYNHSVLVGLRYAFNAPRPAAPPPAPAAVQPAPARTYLVFFDWDRADLTDRARQIVAEAANASRTAQVTRIEVAGHADRSGTPQYNQRLSQRRAEVVAAELARNGVPRSAMVIQAFGESRPLVPTADGVREPQNRRVEIVLR